MESSRPPPTDPRALNALRDSIRAGERVDAGGLWGSSAPFLVAELAREGGPVMVVLAPDERSAAAFREDLSYFLRASVPLYPAADLLPSGDREERALLSERLSILARLSDSDTPSCLVTPASGLLVPVPEAEALAAVSLTIEKGEVLDLDALATTLKEAEYRPSPMVTAPAEYSIRGDIVDIYPMALRAPLTARALRRGSRVPPREIDLETQRSVKRLDRATVPLPRYRQARATSDLPAHLPEGAVLVRLEPEVLKEKFALQAREFGLGGENGRDAWAWSEAQPGLDIRRVATGTGGETAFTVHPAKGLGRLVKDIGPSIEELLTEVAKLTVLCQTKAEGERLKEVFREQDFRFGRRVELRTGRLAEGFLLPEWGLGFINHHELLQRLPVRRERAARKIKARALESFTELDKGDLVVHLVHGIARYQGIERMEREGGQEDFLTLVFEGESVLFVPASKIHLVEKYVGGEGNEPKLDKLGGKGFARRRDRVESALRDVAADLLELQAVRDQERGFAFPPDDELQVLFDASFPYEDTEDQARTMEQVKGDMERARPMDRLLCGDVGFGKTELAVRAAFKAVNGGKQVAVLVPTTLLAQQHFETFRHRLADYPVTVEVLSRFRKRKDMTVVLEETRRGRVDILIGTHRLLSRDVVFKDLGLIVIDEEQRFGVGHKEKLKRLKRIVDVLTMTATPIPRTLHLALVGLRDVSSLEIPPEGRMPVKTRVVTKGDEVVRKSLVAELNRGGQVFYLHNRVRTIGVEAERVKRLVPDARVAFAHGQMKEGELERIMRRFIEGELDVLVCTTIIESGIDLPRVNTIVIDRADAFGLADLHQLRGRVGRGHVKAQALLLVPPGRLPDVALRRLKAIEELSQLGSGFKIALKDLEIRGAGNILGLEQHGHIAAVGYELYCRLLKQTILKMQGKIPEDEIDEVELDLRADAFIPPRYIPDESLRMEMLRHLGRCASGRQIRDLEGELRDRFGRLPRTVKALLDLAAVRIGMKMAGIRSILHPLGSPHLLVEIFDGERFARHEPFDRRYLRFLEPMKAHLIPPPKMRRPEQLLSFLKSRLMPRHMER